MALETLCKLDATPRQRAHDVVFSLIRSFLDTTDWPDEAVLDELAILASQHFRKATKRKSTPRALGLVAVEPAL